MNEIGKLAAFAILLVPYNMIAIRAGLSANDWRYWALIAPVLIGVHWIVEKLNKIK